MLREAKKRNLEPWVDSPSKRRIDGDRSIDAGINVTEVFHGGLQLSGSVSSGKRNCIEHPKEPLSESVSYGFLPVVTLKCRACYLRHQRVPDHSPPFCLPP